ncbi:MAG: phage tail assembly protein [Burkholderia gladioli]
METIDKVVLQYPYDLADGRKLTSVRLRRPTVLDLKLAQRRGDSSADHEIAMIAGLIEERVTPEDLEAMDLADYAEIQAMFRRMQTRRADIVEADGAAGAVVPLSA